METATRRPRAWNQDAEATRSSGRTRYAVVGGAGLVALLLLAGVHQHGVVQGQAPIPALRAQITKQHHAITRLTRSLTLVKHQLTAALRGPCLPDQGDV